MSRRAPNEGARPKSLRIGVLIEKFWHQGAVLSGLLAILFRKYGDFLDSLSLTKENLIIQWFLAYAT